VKIGKESRAKTGLAIALAVIAVILLLYNFVGEANQQASKTSSAPPGTGKTKRNSISSLDPTLRTDLLRTSEETKYEGKGRNIFQAQAEPLPQPTTPVVQKPAVPIYQGPPPPPPIDMKFIGFAKEAGQQKKIFLMQNNDVFVAGEGDIVNRRYKVLKINQNSVEIEDVLNNNRQSIPLTQS
jgi:hypothetical protein